MQPPLDGQLPQGQLTPQAPQVPVSPTGQQPHIPSDVVVQAAVSQPGIAQPAPQAIPANVPGMPSVAPAPQPSVATPSIPMQNQQSAQVLLTAQQNPPIQGGVPAESTLPRSPRKSGRGWLIGVVVTIFLLGFGVLSIAFSDTGTSEVDSTLTTPRPVVKTTPIYMSAADMTNIKSIITNATTLLELEESLNKAYKEIPFEQEIDGKLGLRAPRFILKLSDTSKGPFHGEYTPLDETDLAKTKQALTIIVEENARYPLQLAGGFMNAVIIGKGVGSSDAKSMNRAAGQANLTILFDLDELAVQTTYSRRVVNHETWHAHDFESIRGDVKIVSGGDVDTAVKKAMSDYEASWASLNSAGLSAYSNAPFNNNDPSTRVEHPKPGFATGYAVRNTYEDAAVTFEYLMAKELRPKLLAWAKTDADLQKKIDRIKEHITAYNVIIDPDKDLFER